MVGSYSNHNFTLKMFACLDFEHFFLSVLESFRDYVTVESLDGDNKYDAGEHGLQVIMLGHISDILNLVQTILWSHCGNLLVW